MNQDRLGIHGLRYRQMANSHSLDGQPGFAKCEAYYDNPMADVTYMKKRR